MKKFSQLYLGALAIFAIALAGAAQAGQRPALLVDSTGFQPGVVGTALPVPPAAANGGLPAGYREYTYPMGNRRLGADSVGLSNVAFYLGLRYPLIAAGTLTSITVPCAGYAGPGELQLFNAQAGQRGVPSNIYWVCEPSGTRTILQKIVP